DLGGGVGVRGDPVLTDPDVRGVELADLGGVGVPDGAVGALDRLDDTGGSLGARAPFDRPVTGDIVGPGLLGRAREVLGEVLRRAGLVRAVDDGDLRRGQVG